MLKVFFRLWLYWVGVRFYETDVTPSSAEVLKTELKTVKGQEIHFFFYREAYKDIVYRQGNFYSSETHAFIVQAKFDDEFGHHVTRFNQIRYFFRSPFFSKFEDQFIADILLELYIEFLENEISPIK